MDLGAQPPFQAAADDQRADQQVRIDRRPSRLTIKGCQVFLNPIELNRAQDEFISVVSHELRTPVSGVLGFLQTSLDHWEVMSDADRHNAVRRAFTNARRLQAMTRDVLDTESIESGRFGYVKHDVDLTEEVRTAVEAFSRIRNRSPRSIKRGHGRSA